MNPPYLLYFFAAVLVYVVLSAIDKEIKAQKKRRLQQSTCNGAPTILVVMHAYKDNYAAACTMRNMLQASLCPRRLRFSIIQSVTSASKDVYSLYTEVSAYDNAVVPSSDVRVKTFHSQYPTTLEAYNVALQLYEGEDFVLFTSPGTIFANHFDVELVRHHDGNPHTVLTSHGKPFQMGQVQPPSAHPNILAYMAATFPENVPVDRTTWFPCFETTESGFPIMTSRAAPNIQTTPLRAIGCSAICSMFKGMPILKYGDEDDSDASFILSNSLYHQQYRFYCPPCTLAFPRSTRPKYHKSFRSCRPSKYYQFAAVGTDRNTCYGRARLGLLPDFTTQEIIRKYGNEENFQLAKSTR